MQRGSQSTTHPDPGPAEEARFRDLAAQWKRETINVSSTSRLVMHPSYQRIIGMGRAALPFILRELQVHPDWWFWALSAITGENPVPSEKAGSLKDMTTAWLAWGHEHGYLPR